MTRLKLAIACLLAFLLLVTIGRAVVHSQRHATVTSDSRDGEG